MNENENGNRRVSLLGQGNYGVIIKIKFSHFTFVQWVPQVSFVFSAAFSKVSLPIEIGLLEGNVKQSSSTLQSG